MKSPDPDQLAKATYAKRALRDREIKSWEHLPEHARDHWRAVVKDVVTAQAEILAAEEVTG